ncbi:unnamed protein product [Owenia fusiformis]|uniref:Uncharacterized protein n=1 Tax=Owenia fusiformis TaxID=6347 RepID=A0A8S4PYX1_OWEFU|nr:unnamed protein product [Owenia fusiformis]
MSYKKNSEIRSVGYYTDKYTSNDDTTYNNTTFVNETPITDVVYDGALQNTSPKESKNPANGLYNGDVFPVTEKKEKEVEYEDLDDGGAHAKKLFNYKLAKTFLIIGSWTVNVSIRHVLKYSFHFNSYLYIS